MDIIAINNHAQDIISTTTLISQRLASEMLGQENLVNGTSSANVALHAANNLFLRLHDLKNLKHDVQPLAQLQQELIQAVQQFEQTLKLNGIPAMLVLVYRYLLCTVIDEAVLASAWGKQHFWGRHSLLTIFHQDNQGGEKFFTILEKMQQAPQRNLAVLEFIYFCLSLGFTGKYQLFANGLQQLETLRQQLYALIRQQRTATIEPLSAAYIPPTSIAAKASKWLWYVLTVLLVSFAIFAATKFALVQQAKPDLQTLKQLTAIIATSSRITP